MMKPLDDITVIEVGQVVSVPFAGMLLADMGADVIKIERPGTGDSQRHVTPGSHSIGDFELLNRSKKSLELDLTTEDGQQVFHDLLTDADLLIENLSPGAFDRLGLPFEALATEYDDLVIGSLKGFGEGPYEDRLGMDHPIEVESGMTYMTGLEDRPLRVGFSVVDITSAMYLVQGALAVLRRRPLDPEDRIYTVGMFETASLLMGQPMSYACVEGEAPEPLNESIFKWAVYDYFDTADDETVFVGLVSDAQWQRFAEAFGLTDLLEDPELQDESSRVEQRSRIQRRVSEAISSHTAEEALEKCDSIDVPYARLQTPAALLDDEHLRDKQVTWEQDGTEMRLPLPPMEGGFFQYRIESVRAPDLGEDTVDVLAAFGYSEEEIATLSERGVVGINNED